VPAFAKLECYFCCTDTAIIITEKSSWQILSIVEHYKEMRKEAKKLLLSS
jgi:ribosomal silencing factor RsfS